MNQTTVKHFGSPGHCIIAHSCIFHLFTQVGAFMVSTIGDYKSPIADGFTDVGYQRKFETMVFNASNVPCECGCGAPQIDDWAEIECQGYQTRNEANSGHAETITKYLNLQQNQTP